MPRKRYIPDFFFIANDRCLDFINTELIEWNPVVDRLRDFSCLVEWLRRAELLSAEEANSVLSRWDGRPEGEGVLERAKEFRKVLREGMVQRIMQGGSVELSVLDEINRYLRYYYGYYELLPSEDGFRTRFQVEYKEPIQLLGPIAESAVAFLQKRDFSVIKRCENPACMLYFYDTSRNHTRRWCSMSLCGNRIKAAAHYRRHRGRKRGENP